MRPDIEKAALRRTLIARREIHRKSDNNSINQSITEKILKLSEVDKASVVCVYVSRPGEVETHALIDRFEAHGVTVVVPRIVDRVQMQAMPFPGWTAMQPGPMGLLAPPPGPQWDDAIDVAVVPGLGFSPAGDRLGFGAGFYDRWLCEHLEMVKIGLGFDFQIVPEIPVAAHDVRMDLVVTESRLDRIGTG